MSNLALDRMRFGSSSLRALLKASTGKRFLNLSWTLASSSLSFGTYILILQQRKTEKTIACDTEHTGPKIEIADYYNQTDNFNEILTGFYQT